MTCPRHDCEPPGFEGVDPLSAEVFRAFKRMMRLNRQLMARQLGGEGAHPAQAGCLMVLERHEGITQRELAERLHLAPATVTSMLQRMEREGAIERWTDPDDQRLTRIRLTAEGHELARRQGAAFASYINAAIGPLPDKDRRELARLMNLLADNVARELER